MKLEKKVAYASIFLLAVFFISKRKEYPRFPLVPPPPVTGTGTQIWIGWAATIFSIYGSVKELWEEGGPFNGLPPNDPAFQEVPGYIDPTGLV